MSPTNMCTGLQKPDPPLPCVASGYSRGAWESGAWALSLNLPPTCWVNMASSRQSSCLFCTFCETGITNVYLSYRGVVRLHERLQSSLRCSDEIRYLLMQSIINWVALILVRSENQPTSTVMPCSRSYLKDSSHRQISW